MVEGSVDLQELQALSNGEKDETQKSDRKFKFLMEPALVGAMMAINLGQTSLQNFYLRTACSVDLGYNIEVCDSLAGGPYEAESQKVVSGVNISRSFVGALISTVVLLFVGPWSDCSGCRKPLLIMPLVGMSVMTTAVLLLLTFPGAATVHVLYAVQIPISLGGNFGLLLAAAFSHIGDICHATGRDVTRTMGTHRAAIQIASVIGCVGGPLLFRSLGYYGVFSIVLLLQVFALIYVIIGVEDVNVNADNTVSVFNWRLPLNAVTCLVKARDGYKRVIILLMLIVALGDRMMLSAEVLLSYMYYRYKFNWTDVMFGSFLAYRNVVSFIGTLLILAVLKRRLNFSDEAVGFFSCISYILATFGLIMTSTASVVFALPFVGIIAQGSQVVQRPILNKQILPNEQGKIYSVLGALESATQTFSSPLYSLLYKKTVASMADAWLIPGISLAFLQSIAYLTTRKLRRCQEPQKNTVQLEKLESKETCNEKEKLNESKEVIKRIQEPE